MRSVKDIGSNIPGLISTMIEMALHECAKFSFSQQHPEQSNLNSNISGFVKNCKHCGKLPSPFLW